METSETKVTEECVQEFKIELEKVEKCTQILKEHLGRLLNILKLTGIPICEGNRDNMQGYFLDVLQKLCYPIFLHSSLLYLWYATIRKGVLDYALIIDMVLPLLPCVMWLKMRMSQNSLKKFSTDLSNNTSRNFTLHNRNLLYSTNSALCLIFLYPVWLTIMRISQGNVTNVKEIFRILQETVFPTIMVITYSSICYLLLQNLRFCTKMFYKTLNLACPTSVRNVTKVYLDVVKNVEVFEDVLSNIAFVLVLHNFCVVSIIVMDIMHGENWMSNLMLEALSELIFICASLGVLTSIAGDISLEMTTIRSVILEKVFTQLDQDDSSNNVLPSNNVYKRITLLLKKDACILTAGKAFTLDRGFLLKALATVIAQAVVFYELGLSIGSKSNNSFLENQNKSNCTFLE